MTKKKGGKGKAAQSKIQKSRNGSSLKTDADEHKIDYRTKRNKLKKERRLKEFHHGDYSDDDFVQFRRQLDYQGFKLREIQGDGYVCCKINGFFFRSFYN